MYVRARVTAGARKESVLKKGAGEFEIHVREKALRNQANARVLFLVARECGVSPSSVRLVNGHRSPAKLFRIARKGES